MKYSELSGYIKAVENASKEIGEINSALKAADAEKEIIALLMAQSENIENLAENTSRALGAILGFLAQEELK